jgi:drug/metabolite transporter superfamily protein YnfA
MLFLYLYIIYLISAFAGGFTGFQSWVRIEKLNKRSLLNAILIILFLFTLLMTAYLAGFFPQAVAAPFMA